MHDAPLNIPRTHRLRSERGMTLIEILVVLAIVAGLMSISVYTFGLLTQGDLKRDAMKMTSAIKYTYNQAALNNTQYRMVLDLDANTYHTEVVKSALVDRPASAKTRKEDEELLTEEARKLAAKRKRETDLYDEKEENPFGISRRVSYERVQDGVLKDGKLGDGVTIEKVYLGEPEAKEEGKVSVNFFPNGYQEAAIIIIKNPQGSYYSLQLEPFTGRVLLFSKELDPPSNYGEVEMQDDR